MTAGGAILVGAAGASARRDVPSVPIDDAEAVR